MDRMLAGRLVRKCCVFEDEVYFERALSRRNIYNQRCNTTASCFLTVIYFWATVCKVFKKVSVYVVGHHMSSSIIVLLSTCLGSLLTAVYNSTTVCGGIGGAVSSSLAFHFFESLLTHAYIS